MSRIARRLCDEIEAPLRRNDSQRYWTTGKYDDKPKRSIVIEKQKVISKVVPNNRSVSRIKFKSNETVLNKSFTDTAVNTTLRGPLVSDSNCVTLVRNRTHEKCNCKAPQKYSFRRNGKEVQTFDPKLYSFLDKACFHCVDTVTCGTQFLNFTSQPQEHTTTSRGVTLDSRQIDKSQRDYVTHGVMQRDSFRQANVDQSVLRQLELRKLGLKQTDLGQRDTGQYELMKCSNKIPSVNYMGARRWSLSQYPARGPDF